MPRGNIGDLLMVVHERRANRSAASDKQITKSKRVSRGSLIIGVHPNRQNMNDVPYNYIIKIEFYKGQYEKARACLKEKTPLFSKRGFTLKARNLNLLLGGRGDWFCSSGSTRRAERAGRGNGGLDFQKFDFKYKRGIRTDVRTRGALAVRKVRRNKKFRLGPHVHELQRFGPAGDDAGNRERGGLSALIGTVEFFSVKQGARGSLR